MKRYPDLRDRLNMSYTILTNKTFSRGPDDLPELICNTTVFPEYLALYSELGLYHRHTLTGVCFYEYDSDMDSIHGLYEAIYHNDRYLLATYKKRFEGVPFFITPDYSQCGDAHAIENKHRLLRSRIVGLWLIHEIGAVVIPHITFARLPDINYALTGLERCSVVAFSTKGYVKDQAERECLLAAIKAATDNLPLKAIVVYDVCAGNESVDQMFDYPKSRGIEIIVPMNTLKERNMLKSQGGEPD